MIRRVIAYYLDRIFFATIALVLVYNIFLLDMTNPIGFFIIFIVIFPWIFTYMLAMGVLFGFDTEMVMLGVVLLNFELVISSFFELSTMKGSPGKFIMVLRVSSISSKNIQMKQIILRNIYKLISTMLFYIPFITIVIKNPPYVLHDKLTGVDIVSK